MKEKAEGGAPPLAPRKCRCGAYRIIRPAMDRFGTIHSSDTTCTATGVQWTSAGVPICPPGVTPHPSFAAGSGKPPRPTEAPAAGTSAPSVTEPSGEPRAATGHFICATCGKTETGRPVYSRRKGQPLRHWHFGLSDGHCGGAARESAVDRDVRLATEQVAGAERLLAEIGRTSGVALMTAGDATARGWAARSAIAEDALDAIDRALTCGGVWAPGCQCGRLIPELHALVAKARLAFASNASAAPAAPSASPSLVVEGRVEGSNLADVPTKEGR